MTVTDRPNDRRVLYAALRALVVFSVVAFLWFVTARLRMVQGNEFRIETLEKEVRILTAKLNEHEVSEAPRIGYLETVVTKALDPETKTPVQSQVFVERWSRNRDAIVSKRLADLERRLLQVEPPR